MKEHRDRWLGQMAICIGGGPSLTLEQCEFVKGRCRVIAVNDSYRLAPWADVVYGCDFQWWKIHRRSVRLGTSAELWTGNEQASREFALTRVKTLKGECLPSEAGIAFGMDGGFQALQLALWWGASPIILIGYDQQHVGNRTHWHGGHAAPLLNTANFRAKIATYHRLASVLNSSRVVNCTTSTALTCFKRRPLQEMLQ